MKIFDMRLEDPSGVAAFINLDGQTTKTKLGHTKSSVNPDSAIYIATLG